MFVNRGIYSDGWWAASRVGIPWESGGKPVDPDTAKWELYNLTDDFSQANDIAAKNSEKLRQLQDMWWTEAARYSVLPLDGRKTERLNGELQGRPSLTGGRTKFTYYPGTVALPAGSAPNVLNKSFSIDAEIDNTSAKAEGVIFAMGGSDGGYGIYVRDGKPVFAGNFLGRSTTRVTSDKPLPSGPAKLQCEFKYDGGGMGKGGTMTLVVNGQKVGEGRMKETQGITLGLGGALDIGEDSGSAVDENYTPPFKFNGTIKDVTVDLQPK